MSTPRFRKSWLFLPLAMLLVVSAPSADRVEVLSQDLVFVALDGSSEDFDGVADGVWTVPHGMALEGRLVCGEEESSARTQPCAMVLRVEGDLVVRAGGGIAADAGLRLDVAGDFRLERGSFVVAERGAVELSARGRIAIDGLVSANRTTAAKGRAQDQKNSAVVILESIGGPGYGVRIGPLGTVLATGGAGIDSRVEVSGCGLDVFGLVASLGSGPASGVAMRSCKDLNVDGRDLADPAGSRRGQVEIQGPDTARIDLFARGSVRLDGAELRVANQAKRGGIAVTAEHGRLDWRRGVGAAGASGSISLTACEGIDLDGSRLAPEPSLAEACAGVSTDKPGTGLVELPPSFSGSGPSESPFPGASGGTCTPNLAVDNMVLSTFEEFISCNVLTSSNTRIIPRARVTYRALTSIELGNGFSVEGSAHFTAILDPTLNQPPSITSDGGGATASKSIPENTTAVTNVDATDPEGETESGGGLTYSLSGPDAAKFSIDAAGMLAFVTAPDFDNPGDADADNDYEVTVTVTDTGLLTDTQDITVTVTDVNEAPVITSDGGGATASVSVDENTTAVTTVTATDADLPAQTLTYAITGGADMAKFSIVGSTGVLTFVMAPDFEVPGDANMDNDYEVEVTVTDDGTPNLSDVQDITVTVDDANDAPMITSDGGGPTAAKSIPENTTAVTDVDATDPEGETESGGGLTYSLSGADAAKFSIDAAGMLNFIVAPDFDIPGDMNGDNDYKVTVKVTDSGGAIDTQAITVTVTDLNEAPVITSDGGGATASVSVDENTTAVTTVTATDEDVPAQTLTYSITGGADMAKFSIVGATGVLTFSAAPNYEIPGDANMDNDYEVEVTVTDDGIPNLSDVQDITVTVEDANDAPVITSNGGGATASVSVDENTTAVTTVTATDADLPAQTLTYSITGGADQAKFSIVGATGVLTFSSAPDSDIPGDANMDNDYEVQVTVTDNGAPNLTDIQDITVTVDDVNEAPVITSNGGGATASVSVDENTTAVTTVEATDEDVPAQTLTYSITGGADQAKFSIVGATGVLTFSVAPNHEIPGDADMDNDYEVEVTVTDDGAPNLSDVQAITVTVDDANDAPVITSNGGGATASVSVDENTTAVTTVTATDADVPAQTLTYSITGGADQAKFSIVGATGVLTFSSAPDSDIPGDANMDNDYEVEVTVTDNGTPNATDIQDITVTVDDVNEAPVITSDGGGATASVSVDENTTAVTTVTATDADVPAQTLTYSITGGADMAKFSIVGTTGVLTFVAAPDFDIPGDANMDNDYEVEVTVTDDGAPNLSDVQDITVTVEDANDAPVITSNGGGATASVSVNENTTAVTTVTATDADVPAQTLTYSITGGADSAKFSIVGATGVLTFSAAPNFEIPGDADMDNDYEVEVTVTDNGTPNATDIQDITVTVDDVNEAPVITSNGGGATASVDVDENTTAVTTLTATDVDLPAQTLTYSITGGADQTKFSIVGATGVLTFSAAPDFEVPGDANMDNDYEVEVTVTDDGIPNLSDVQDITVTVDNVDEAPVGGADAFDFVGNTLLLVDKTTSGSPEIIATTTSTNGVLDNDFDPEMAAISVSGVFANMTPCADMTAPFTDCPTANGGKVTMESTGEFSYTPKAGDTLATDKFGYNVSDGVNTTDVVVTLTRKNRVWYVKNDNMSGTDDGTSADPFDTLGEASTASLAGDTIFVFEGAGTTAGQDAGISLKTMQRLLGEGVALTVPDTVNGVGGPTLFAAGTKPAIEHATAMMDGITVDATSGAREGIEIRGLSISGTRNAIDVTSSGMNAVSITITDNLFDDSGEEAIDLNPGGSEDFVATIEDNTFSTSSPTGNAIDLVKSGSGDVEVAINRNTKVTSSSGTGINLDGTAGGGTLFVTGFADNTVNGATGGTGIRIQSATFDADTGTAGFQEVDAGTTTVGSGGDPVGGSGVILGTSANPVSGNLLFDQLDVFASSGTIFGAAGSAQASGGDPPTAGFELNVTTGTLTGFAKGLELDLLTANTTFTTLVSTNSPAQGVDITSTTGTVVIGGGAIVGSAGTAFDIGDTGDMTGGNADVTFGGIINNSAGRAVLIQQRSGGTITLSGDITETGDGIRLANNTDGDNTITFSGATKTVNTGTDTAVRLDNNESGGNEATINFTGGGLDIDVSTGLGLHATGGGILNITGSGNTITTTNTGQAVVMNGMDLGASDVTFDSITSTGTGGGAPLGDVLSFTNVDNAGTFAGGTVTIDDTAASGDGIDINGGSANYDFTSFTAASASGNGINVDSATGDITFDTINLDAPGGHGVRINAYAGAGGDNFTISGGTIDDPGSAGVSIAGATSQVNIGSVVIDDTGTQGVAISGSSGTINVTNTTIGEVGGSATTTGGNALDIDGGAGTITVSGSIVNTAGKSVEITGRTGGSVNISSSIDDDGTGISITGNTGGTFNFSGGMALDTGSNTAFNATGGGTVNVTGTNTIGAAGAISGIGVDIDNVDIGASGLTFASLAVSGANHGIRIKNAAGNATFTTVAISGTVQGAVQTFLPFSAMNTRETPQENGNGDGIYLQDNTGTFTVNGGTITSSGDNAVDIFDAGGITISGVTIDGSANTAVQATRVAGLSIIDSMIKNFGNATAVSTARENAISLREVTGAINLQRSTIDTGFGFVFERFAQLPENIGLELNNIAAAPATLTVTGSTIKKLDFQGMQVRYQNSNVTVRLNGSTADGPNALSLINGAAIDFGQTAADNGSTGTLVVNDSTFTDVGIGTRVGNLSNTGGAPASVTNVRLEDNVITRTFAEGFRLRGFGGPNRSTFNMRIIDNDIFDVGRAVSTVGGAGQTGAGNGIESLLEDRIDARILIDGNTIDDVTPDAGSLGVNIRTTDGTDLDLVFTNNMVLDVGNPTQGATGSPTGIVEIGAFANGGEPNPDTCVHFTGNTLTPRPSAPAIFTNLFLDDTSPAAKYILQGLITGGDSVAASTFLDMSNTWPPAQFPGITVGVANLLDAHASETCSTPPAIP